jgi:hypothetical protein
MEERADMVGRLRVGTGVRHRRAGMGHHLPLEDLAREVL